jgi:hypothetical protein
MRLFALLITVVLPGITFASVSTYYLLPEWAALNASVKSYDQVAKSPSSTMRDVFIAQSAENRHRINCFAEGVGVLLGSGIFAIGMHGILTQPRKQPDSNHSLRSTPQL